MSPNGSSESEVPVLAGAPAQGAEPGPRGLWAVFETMRPHQWLKNVLVLAPAAAAHRLAEPILIGQLLRVFVAWCCCASAIYVLNDVIDAPADRRHPHKRYRPIASGRLSVARAIVLAAILAGIGVALASKISASVLLSLLAYMVLMSSYALALRALVLIDVFVLAGGYALRVFSGGLAVHIPPSPWLIAFCIFVFLSLALLKRYTELGLLRHTEGSAAHARAYVLADRPLVLALGVACAVVSVLVLALYLTAADVGLRHAHPELIWVTGVLLLYWLSFLWLVAQREHMTDDPLVFALKSRASVLLIVLMGVSAWLAA